MRFFLIILLTILLHATTFGQYLVGASTVWDDSAKEWEIYYEQDSTLIEGELEVTFSINNRYDKWSFSIGDLHGDVRQIFSNDDSRWELSSSDRSVSIRQVWPRDKSEWILTDDHHSIRIRTRYNQSAQEWINTDHDNGDLYVYTTYEGDYRDWTIEDYMSEEISLEMRFAALFIILYNSIPKG